MDGAALVAVAAVVVAVTSILAGAGRLRRNSVVGLRIPSLYASDAAWRAGHRAAILPTAAAGLLCVVITVAVFVNPDWTLAGLVLETAVLVVGVLAATALAHRAARTR